MNRTLFALSISSLIVNLAYGLIMPFIPLYLIAIGKTLPIPLIGELGMATQVGLLASGFMLSRAFLAPRFGALSDRVGRKPLVLVGIIFYGFLSALYGFATSFWMLFIARFFQGVASAAVWPVAEALVVDTSHEDEVGKNIGLFMFSMQLGWASGPFVGSAGYYLINTLLDVSGLWSYRILFFSTAVLSFISAIYCYFEVNDPKEDHPMNMHDIWLTILVMFTALIKSSSALANRAKRPLFSKPKTFLAIYAYGLLNGFAFSSIFPLMTVFLLDYYNMSTEAIGLVVGLAGLVGMMMTPLGGSLADRFSKIQVLWFSTVMGGIMLLILGVRLSITLLIAFFILRQLFMAMRMPVFRALQADVIPAELRGEEFGTVQMFFNTGSIIGPVFGGVLYDFAFHYHGSLTIPFPLLGGLTLEILGIMLPYIITVSLSLFALFLLTLVFHHDTKTMDPDRLPLVPVSISLETSPEQSIAQSIK